MHEVTFYTPPRTAIPYDRFILGRCAARARLILRGYLRASLAELHQLDVAALWLVGRFIVTPMLALRGYIRNLARSGGFTAATAEPAAHRHEVMLGIFAVPGFPWALALVMQGNPDRLVKILASSVVRLDAGQLEQERMAIDYRRYAIGRALAGMRRAQMFGGRHFA